MFIFLLNSGVYFLKKCQFSCSFPGDAHCSCHRNKFKINTKSEKFAQHTAFKGLIFIINLQKVNRDMMSQLNFCLVF